ncbi:phosphate ABC transporter permease PstA [Glaciecola sp. KUL10]|uniref:phosphate ABC transporter permease PstA n=1 Tax=Glaciecola sp. (strain KUL10) TaxID=2161813 RepID=UPI000D78AB2C|nr:phosphate ABC transporter permease PstA [Glaciecola sp. KUL10]
MAKTKLNHQQLHAFSSITSGFAAALLLITLIALVIFISIRGSAYFWPMTIYQVDFTDTFKKQTSTYQISAWDKEELLANLNSRVQSQFVNQQTEAPYFRINISQDVFQVILKDGKVKLGKLVSLNSPNGVSNNFKDFEAVQENVKLLLSSLETIQFEQMAPLHERLSQYDKNQVAEDAPARLRVLDAFFLAQEKSNDLQIELEKYFILFEDAQKHQFRIDIRDIEAVYQPNEMEIFAELEYMLERIVQFLGDSPKQAATSGGVFPALFGTVMMVLIMAVLVAPLGIMAAIYLHEYAPETAFTSFIRISVSNMAGVPSVVYGVFGLGFFVYVVGGTIDSLFYTDSLPSPTFGAPGLFWAALTMALLTLPVVIVSTEEGLRRVPGGLRAGAYALGATKWETVTKTVVPIASPGMITGLILAIARAAGEVAPLILVGAVKFAPSLPVDGEFPFLHLERQFMHLGVFIYDGAFHNQTNTQGSAMMFASCLLLLIIVFVLNLFAIVVRNKLRNRYTR